MIPVATASEETAPGAYPPVLDVRNLTSGYASSTVVRDVSLIVPRGGVVALLGPNGAGKTTLLRTISGLLTATSGTVELDGLDITRMPPHRRFASGLCHIPEGRGVYRHLSVAENLMMQAPRGSESEAVEKATAAFPVLRERLTQRAGTMSGGEQQMLAVAAAHVRDPRLVLVDEVSLGLAPMVVDQIFHYLEELRDRGTALLVVDQFVSRALGIADAAYMLRRGAIVFAGSPSELQSSGVFEQYLGAGGPARSGDAPQERRTSRP